MKPILAHIKISRPGLWFPTIWIYLLPFGEGIHFVHSANFWVGLFFVTFPLNYFVYSLNDFGDYAADRDNNRKGNYLFGAKESKKTLQQAVRLSTILLVGLMFFYTSISNWLMVPLFACIILFNYAYNFEPFRIKDKPPLELLIQTGYILTAYFSIELNGLETLPWQTIVYLMFFCFQAHLAGEIMDIDPDKNAGKTTSAVLLGRVNSKLLMATLVVIEVCILIFWFQDYILASCLALFFIWLLADVFVLYQNKPYTLAQMKFFGYAMNAIALGSMIWMLWSGKLMDPV